ncbi:hypothetical protein COX73_02230, partial [bacterium (Candidatus Gribaldobacteria) CG_4_10_14_0_2_um_filter_36_18]
STEPSNFFLSTSDPSLISGQVKTVYIWTKDEADNVSQLGNSASIILDTTPPQTEIEQGPPNPTNQTQAIFSFSANEDNCIFECKIDQGEWENCSSSKNYQLLEGEHNFSVRASDQATNEDPEPAQYSWLIDVTPPISEVEELATSSTLTSFNLSWSGSDTGSGILNYDIQSKDGLIGDWQDLVMATTSISTEFTGQDEHTYYFRSRARDKAENIENWPEEPDAFSKIEIPKDEVPPCLISDLKAETGTNSGEIILSWTAPGDDGDTGQASKYIIKYGPEEITENNWASSTIVENPPSPQPSGSEEKFIVSDLGDNTLYYFAIKTKDESENLSEISNSPMAKTLNQPPVAMFSYQPENPKVEEEILFDASDSYDSDGLITDYIWDFGDNGSTTTSLATTTHIFNTTGQFQVILLVKDDEGTTSEPVSALIEVLEKPKPKILISEVQIKDKEFVELYNFGEETVSTTGWYLSYFSANKNWSDPQRNWQFSATATISAQNFYLIGIKDYPEENGNPDADWQVLTQEGNPYLQGQLSNERGAVGIFSCDPSVSTSQLAENCKIDLFAWQEEDTTTTLVFEGNPFSFNENEIEEKSFQRRKENENYI